MSVFFTNFDKIILTPNAYKNMNINIFDILKLSISAMIIYLSISGIFQVSTIKILRSTSNKNRYVLLTLSS